MKKKKPQQPEHICDDCACGRWQTQQWNRTPEGLPITLRCPHYKEGKAGILRGTPACNKFEPKK